MKIIIPFIILMTLIFPFGCDDSDISDEDYDKIKQELNQAQEEISKLTDQLADASTKTKTDSTVQLMYVQEAAEGTLTSNGDETFSLTLTNTTPYTVYFSDRPATLAGNLDMQRFIDTFDWDSPPNAAIVLQDVEENEDTLMVQLLSPSYDQQTTTLSYTIKLLKDYDGKGLAFFHKAGDASLPESFSKISLYIDNCSWDPSLPCCPGIIQYNCIPH